LHAFLFILSGFSKNKKSPWKISKLEDGNWKMENRNWDGHRRRVTQKGETCQTRYRAFGFQFPFSIFHFPFSSFEFPASNFRFGKCPILATVLTTTDVFCPPNGSSF